MQKACLLGDLVRQRLEGLPIFSFHTPNTSISQYSLYWELGIENLLNLRQHTTRKERRKWLCDYLACFVFSRTFRFGAPFIAVSKK